MLGGTQKAAAQVGSVQDFMKMMGAVGSKLIVPGGLNATMAQFVKEVRPSFTWLCDAFKLRSDMVESDLSSERYSLMSGDVVLSSLLWTCRRIVTPSYASWCRTRPPETTSQRPTNYNRPSRTSTWEVSDMHGLLFILHIVCMLHNRGTGGPSDIMHVSHAN